MIPGMDRKNPVHAGDLHKFKIYVIVAAAQSESERMRSYEKIGTENDRAVQKAVL